MIREEDVLETLNQKYDDMVDYLMGRLITKIKKSITEDDRTVNAEEMKNQWRGDRHWIIDEVADEVVDEDFNKIGSAFYPIREWLWYYITELIEGDSLMKLSSEVT